MSRAARPAVAPGGRLARRDTQWTHLQACALIRPRRPLARHTRCCSTVLGEPPCGAGPRPGPPTSSTRSVVDRRVTARDLDSPFPDPLSAHLSALSAISRSRTAVAPPTAASGATAPPTAASGSAAAAMAGDDDGPVAADRPWPVPAGRVAGNEGSAARPRRVRITYPDPSHIRHEVFPGIRCAWHTPPAQAPPFAPPSGQEVTTDA